MRNKIISMLLVAILSAICNSVNAKNASDANIGGHVVDKETGEHLPGCLITILNSGYVSMTDASGHYIFRDLTPGEYELQVSFMGYMTQKKTAKVIEHHTTELNFEIEADACSAHGRFRNGCRSCRYNPIILRRIG